MYRIHKVLVNAPTMSEAIQWAEYFIEREARNVACEFYALDDVFRASDGLDEFLAEVRQARQMIIKRAKKILDKEKPLLLKLSKNNYEPNEEDKEALNSLTKAIRLLNGDWIHESEFYSEDDHSSLVSERTIFRIKERPEEYWLVSFVFSF